MFLRVCVWCATVGCIEAIIFTTAVPVLGCDVLPLEDVCVELMTWWAAPGCCEQLGPADGLLRNGAFQLL